MPARRFPPSHSPQGCRKQPSLAAQQQIVAFDRLARRRCAETQTDALLVPLPPSSRSLDPPSRPPSQAKYTDPKSTLRYHNPEVYDVLRTFQPAVIQAYLAVRGQGVVLR